ncbi:HD domain-containing protein [Patescibacteria group bacterium]|nr:HD domain-containing protein [Patescibacteria group bacterium]
MPSLLDQLHAQNPLLIGAVTDLCRLIAKEPVHPVQQTVPRAFLVGGYVRDLLIQEEPKDADVEVFGVEAERLQALLEALFPGQIHDVGRSFGVLKVHLSHGVEFDVAIARSESKTAPGHKGFAINSNPYLSSAEAARRRDFTINAISLDPLTGEILDPTDGQKDLAARVLRVVDPKTFVDDPLRVYRAVQFLARFELTLDPASKELMIKMVKEGHLKELSAERITEELTKLLLLAKRPSLGFELLRELGVITADYPELQALINTPQEPEWHPEGDVWIHTMMVVDQAAKIIRRPQNADFTREERLQAVFGALCHDLGKPSTTRRQEKNGVMCWRSLGHQEAGEAPTLALCERLRFSESVVHAARMIALHHLRPSEYYIKKQKGELTDASYSNTIRTLLKRIKPLHWRVMHASAEADFRGRGFPDAETRDYPYGTLFQDTIEREELDKEALHPLVLGHELIERFGLEPGPYIGNILRTIENARDEGSIQTKEQALILAEDLIKNRGHHE